jgi:putative ABC transport system ATP-binding protein
MLEIINLNKQIEDRSLLENINLTVEEPAFYVLTGISGSGKSTLLNIIGGLDYDYTGDIYINKVNTSNKERQKYFDFLFQNYGLIESETIGYNLRLVKKVNPKKYYQLLEVVNLKHDLDQYVYTLSGGEQQRLAIARLLLSNRKFILADEPTASLDIENRDYVLEMLRALNNAGKTIILVTHDEHVINELSKYYKVLVLENSQINLKNKK